MKILVTGSSGFIGQRVVQRLVSKGHQVTGSSLTPIKVQPKDHSFMPADLARLQSCEALVNGVEVVIHCAGKAGAWGPRSEYEIANVVATKNMLEAAEAAQVQRFINLSSPSIYFDYKNQIALKEDQIPAVFSNAYAETKYLAEELVRKANTEQFKTLSLRPRGVVGAGDRNWLPRIIGLRQANKLIQPGDGTNKVDFTSVENLVDAIELCMTTPGKNCGRAYNLTDGTSEYLWEFIEYALSLVGLDGKRMRVPTQIAMAMARLSEKYHILCRTKQEPSLLPVKVGVGAYSMTLDISDAQNLLGYAPRISSRAAAQEFADWWNLASAQLSANKTGP